MDKYIELLAFYWVDWEQTAILNTRYSVVLAVLAFFIGVFIIAILKSGKISKLQKSLLQEKQLVEQAKVKHDELDGQLKESVVLSTDLQQQLEQSANTLKQEKEDHQAQIADKDALFLKSSQEKQVEIDNINTVLTEKNNLSEKLQTELNEQQAVVAKAVEAQEKIVELDKLLVDATAEKNDAKQQLQSQLAISSERLAQIERQEESTKTQINRVLELESQLIAIKGFHDTEKAQRLVAEAKQKEQAVLNQQQQKVEIKEDIAPVIEKPAAPQSIKEQPVVAKSTPAPVPAAPVAKKPEPAVVQKQAEPPKPKPQSKPAPVVEKKAAAPKTKKEKEKSGITSKVMGWFSSMDDAFDGESVKEEPEIIETKVEKIEQPEVVPVAAPVQVKTEVVAEPVVTKVDEVKVEKVSAIKAKPEPKIETMDEEEASFSEKLAEMADKMDSYQGKFKGFFNKKKS